MFILSAENIDRFSYRMLEKIFGSRTRVKLFRLFFTHPDEEYFVRQIGRVIGEQINSVRRELNNLEKLGILTTHNKDKKKYYAVNTDYMLYNELRGLILKSRITMEKEFIKTIKDLGNIQYLALTGYFAHDLESPTDLVVVGAVTRPKLESLLRQFQQSFGQQLRYTLMNKQEYHYRKDVTDKFLFTILNGRKIVLINTIDPRQEAYAG